MNTCLQTRSAPGYRAATLRGGLLALLTAATLTACATGQTRPPTEPVAGSPIERFVLAGVDGADVAVGREHTLNPLTGAAAGAVGLPGIVLQTAAYAGGAQVATASVLGPLAVVGLVIGAVRGAMDSAEMAEIRRKHGPSLQALEAHLAAIARPDRAEEAVAGHLAGRFGDRFAGTVRLAEPPHGGTEPVLHGVDCAFELEVRRVEIQLNREGNVTLVATAALRQLRLPGRGLVHAGTLRYASPEPLSPEHLAKDEGAGAGEEIERAWRHFADEIALTVKLAGSEPAVPDAPLRPSHAQEIES